MEPRKPAFERKKHLFRLEIMIEESTHTLALASLLQALNHPKVDDFRILDGMQFGKAIEQIVQTSKPQPFAIPQNQTVPAKNGLDTRQQQPSRKENGDSSRKQGSFVSPDQRQSPPPSPVNAEGGTLNLQNLLHLQESGTLVRITAVKEKGVKLSIPCRILNFDSSAQQLTIYHVDEKKVYSFNLNEIEDIVL
ncbi:hypothetical protein ACFFNY_35345 [Paenibacillus hodogayensis]|uniref:Uncharacterized protein n=1 Tax=Paenibacillus hodogayensis TaxID=279208 RepID=A0ABV5W8G4_9BACL